MAYYVMVALIAGSSVIMPKVLEPAMSQQVSFNGILAVTVLAVIGLYALSWYLAIRFYEKRELK